MKKYKVCVVLELGEISKPDECTEESFADSIGDVMNEFYDSYQLGINGLVVFDDDDYVVRYQIRMADGAISEALGELDGV